MTSVQDFSCIFCKESFEDKETLQIHFRKHGDPKFDQTAKAKVRTQNDSPTTVETSKEENETVSCDVCDESFPTISKAITHKHKFHPDHDAKYFCPWCGKLFTLKHLYNKHMQSTHDSTESKAANCFHCDCCNVDFFNPSAMIYHNKFFHRQDTDLPAIGQSKKVKLITQELVQIYYCPFCGEEYNNKINLHKHMKDDHSDEDQHPENILRCPLCEAVFYHLDAYELHLTFHSSEDLYSEENEMLKQIVEFSLDTVPPLMETMEIPVPDRENEDMNAMGIDQFLQLTMSKDPDDEQPESMEKTKSKKHKKHKKSKKTITLDEFLNMNSDLFGEGLNVHGIEEVPTRIVKKQLNKPKKEQLIRNNHKLVSTSDIDKLKKQGITIKMKSGKGIAPIKNSQHPSISTVNKTIPRKSNVISTSSEVLSKLMNQSNSQVKIIRRGSPSNTNVELESDETNITKEPIASHDTSSSIDDKIGEDPIEHNELDKVDADTSNIDVNFKKNPIGLPDVTTNKTEEVSDKFPDSIFTPLNSELDNTATDEYSRDNDSTNRDTNAAAADDKDENTDENFEPKDINNLNTVATEPILNDFEEELASTTILRSNMTDKSKESQLKDLSKHHPASENVESQQDVATDTLNAIKHLSGLITVKSVNQSTIQKNDDVLNNSSQNLADKSVSEDDERFENDFKKEMLAVDVNKPENQKESTNKTLSALKNLGKHVTIKSLSSQISSPPSKDVGKKSGEETDDDELGNDENTEFPYKSVAKDIVGKKVVNLKHPNKPIMANNSHKVFPAHSTGKMSAAKKSFDDEGVPETDENLKSTSNADLLKRLTNVTAKPIPSKKPIIKKEHSYPTISKQSFSPKNISKQQKINEEIEIFNIDDSDSDGQEQQDSVTDIKTSKLPVNPVNKISRPMPKSNEVLRNLGKNITVKQKEPSNRINQNSFADDEHFPEYTAPFSDDDDDFDNVCKKFNNDVNKFVNQSNKVLESTLKNLGKHITVKPKNMSPNNVQRVHLERNTEQNDRFYENDTGSDSDSKSNRVKITEITDHTASDNEFLSEDDEKNNKNYTIQSPDASHSDNGDDNCSDDEHFDKISDVDTNTSQTMPMNKSSEKPSQSLAVQTQPKDGQKCPLSNFKKFNKEITIKSLKDKQAPKEAEGDLKNNSDTFQDFNNESKEPAVKPFRQNVHKYSSKSENQTTQMQQAASSINEKASTSNQVNTVNKEVSVKTFQSQTVIEEITTTVTKTIRTVKQEVKSASQTNTIPTLKPQKIMNYNNRQPRNAPNMTVRHPSPSIGTKIKNASPNKPSTSGFRPSNQLVPVRQAVNLTRPGNPTLSPTLRNVTPRQVQQKPAASRPLKISPQAMSQTMKRSSQESTQYTCFKKPKESFSADVQTRYDMDGEGSMHMSTSQSRSDFTSTIKNVKGRSVVTATQLTSEMSATSHLNKLGNVSGLKIVKTSSKQVEERIENPGAKRTMEALQKLQMHGLLVKRPRSDGDSVPQNDNDFSNSDSENDEDTGDK